MRDPRSPPAMTTNPSRTPLTALLLLLSGSLGFAAAWVLARRALDTHAAWLAPLPALKVPPELDPLHDDPEADA